MSQTVKRLTEQIEALPPEEHDELLDWLAAHELERMDAWDRQIVQDAQPGGPLERLVAQARQDIAAGRVKPLNEVLDDR